MGFTTRQLILIALVAGLLFVVNFSLGAGVVAATGIPGSSGLVDGLVNLLVLTFVALTIRKFGTVTLLYFIYGIIALPTHMAGGPPGFLPKVLLIAFGGLMFDASLAASRYRIRGLVIGLPIMVVVGFAGYLAVYALLGMPEYSKLLAALPMITAVLIIEGYLGIWLGFKLHKKMKNRKIIKQMAA